MFRNQPATCGRRSVPVRSGISLMEVLISVFVISIGLLGIAALIPVANYSLVETSKSDRSAACGQAAMRDVRVRALADPYIWPLVHKTEPFSNPYANTDGATYVIDPLGPNGQYFGTQVPLVTCAGMINDAPDPDPDRGKPTALAERVFYWNDDLLFDMLEGSDNRPRGFDLDGNGTPDGPIPERSYSWFLTVTPSPMVEGAAGQRRQFTVSVAVCYQRTLDTPTNGIALGGPGNLVLVTPTSAGTIISGIELTGSHNLETGQWVMLSGDNEAGTQVAQWYRVTSGFGDVFTLEGPNWPSSGVSGHRPSELVIVPGVLGVYTTTFEVNHTPEWLR